MFLSFLWHSKQLDRIEQKLDKLLEGQKTTMDNIVKTQQAIDDLTAAVAAETTAVESAVTLISGFAQRLADAIAAASNAGATDDQLSELTALKATVDAEKQKLADAVASTPAV